MSAKPRKPLEQRISELCTSANNLAGDAFKAGNERAAAILKRLSIDLVRTLPESAWPVELLNGSKEGQAVKTLYTASADPIRRGEGASYSGGHGNPGPMAGANPGYNPSCGGCVAIHDACVRHVIAKIEHSQVGPQGDADHFSHYPGEKLAGGIDCQICLAQTSAAGDGPRA